MRTRNSTARGFVSTWMAAVPELAADVIDKGVMRGDTGYIWRMGGFMLVGWLARSVA